MSLLLCLLAFAGTYAAARRSLVRGLGAVCAVGYAYGIVRANVPETFSHFIFDGAAVGLYAAQLLRRLEAPERFRVSLLKPWVETLVAWPVLLLLIPFQDILIQFVGLRGSIFLLPFLLFGARLEQHDRYRLALYIAGLNLVAFAFASAEFVWGIERFYPRNQVTDLIYMSKDVGNYTAYRIPAIFVNAHAYGGTMVVSLPLLIGALVQKHRRGAASQLLYLGLGAALLGVLMSAARTHFVIAGVLVVVTTFSLRSRFGFVLGWLLLLGAVGWMVSGEARLQRFTQLQDTGMVAERVSWSVNMGFLEAAAQYPLGNGLGGGGTSVPYFLQDRIQNPVYMENEYARIMLEQGILGLAIWVGFVLWMLTRYKGSALDDWQLGRRLAWVICAVFFLIALTGTGLLTSVPQTPLFLVLAGWVAARQPKKSGQALSEAPRPSRRAVPVTERRYV